MRGREFELLIAERCQKEKTKGLACVGRYGVQAVRSGEQWHVIPSLPDFEGVFLDGRQMIFDAKVCSQASFALDKYRQQPGGNRRRQLTHMLERSRAGAVCFFLIHWAKRELKTRVDPELTQAVPVHPDCPLWEEFLAGERKSLTRDDGETYGVRVPWNYATDRDRKLRPDFVAAAIQLAADPLFWTSIPVTGVADE